MGSNNQVVTADEEKQNKAVASEAGHELGTTHNNIDVIHVSHERPYSETNFIGTYIAICLGALACYGGFVMPATSLAQINAAIGPSASYYWVILAWSLCLAVGYTLVGRLSDIFGRRWFFIGASILATIGCIVGGTAKSMNAVIAAGALTGLATAGQLSFNYILAELVPVKDRFYVLVLVFTCASPFSCFGPYIARLLIVHTEAGWRWQYYMNIIVNGLSTIFYFVFYHPPQFDELHSKRSQWQEVKDIDFGGIVLFCASTILFILGLSWGGNAYPWASAHVIATIVLGFCVGIMFILYECYMPLRRPLIPMHLFKERDYCVLTTVSAVGGMLYTSLNVLYPTMVAALFTTSITRAGLLSCAIGGGVAAGQTAGAGLATPGGNLRWKLFFSVVACTAFTAALAGSETESTASALAVIASFFVGAIESLAAVSVTIVIKDQSEVGTAAGVYGSIRSIAGAVATAILTTILSNKVEHYTKTIVTPALARTGLPAASIESLLVAISAGENVDLSAIPGVTPDVLGVAVASLRVAWFKSFQIVYLVTIAFGGLSCIAAFFTPAVEKQYTDEVMRRLRPTGGKGTTRSYDPDREKRDDVVAEHLSTV